MSEAKIQTNFLELFREVTGKNFFEESQRGDEKSYLLITIANGVSGNPSSSDINYKLNGKFSQDKIIKWIERIYDKEFQVWTLI